MSIPGWPYATDSATASLGPLHLDHIGVAVLDVDAAIKRFGTLLGIRDWRRAEFRTQANYRGAGEVIGGNVAKGSLGPISLELVQPTLGRWSPVDVLERRGETIYHFGYYVPDIVEATERAEAFRVGAALRGLDERFGLLFSYCEPADMPGVTIELVGPRIPDGFAFNVTEVHL